MNGQGNGKDNRFSQLKDLIATGIGIVALGGFAILIMHLLGRTNAAELEWSRLVYLLSGVEAIAFAAAGYFFGREVNRKRAESAEKRVDVAQANASEAQAKMTAAMQKAAGMKANLEAVHSAIKGRKQARGAGVGHLEARDAQEVLQTAETDFDALEAMVNDLLVSPRT